MRGLLWCRRLAFGSEGESGESAERGKTDNRIRVSLHLQLALCLMCYSFHVEDEEELRSRDLVETRQRDRGGAPGSRRHY